MPTEILNQKFIGTVLKLNKETREIGVFIPKLMSNMYDGDAISYKYPTNSGLALQNLNSNISATVTKINYIWVKARVYDWPLPKIGSKVLIEFLDMNPKLGFWIPFNINNDYEVIDEEKYKTLANVSIGDKTDSIEELDTINISLPEGFNATKTKQDKQLNFNIYEDYSFYKNYSLTESINNLQKSMEYLETEYKKTFIANIPTVLFENGPATNGNFWDISLSSNTTEIPGESENDPTYISAGTTFKNTLSTKITQNYLANYPIFSRQEVYQKLLEVQNSISDENISDAKIMEAARNLKEFLKNYNLSIEEYCNKYFNEIVTKAKSDINASENLLDCGNTFTYYNKLLTGLKETETKYEIYKTAYTNLSSTAKEAIASLHNNYDKDIIDANIQIAFSRALSSSNQNNVDNYVSYIKGLFPDSVNITFKFSTDGQTYTNLKYNTGKLFSLISASDKEIIVDNKKYYIMNIPDICPILDVGNIVASQFVVLNWIEAASTAKDIFETVSNNYTYYLVTDVTVMPKLFGAYITFDENDVAELHVYNDNETADTSYTFYLNPTGTNDIARTLNEINTSVLTGTNSGLSASTDNIIRVKCGSNYVDLNIGTIPEPEQSQNN